MQIDLGRPKQIQWERDNDDSAMTVGSGNYDAALMATIALGVDRRQWW